MATLSTLATFNEDSFPEGPLTLDSAGDLFGTLSAVGGVFELPAGSTTPITLASFSGTNGNIPASGVTFDTAGNLLGVTNSGGDSNGDGVLFKVANDPGRTLTTANFTKATTGASPISPLATDAAGNFYGTTQVGGTGNFGTVFKVAAGTQTITTIANFGGGSNGANPSGPLVVDSAGDVFGTTTFSVYEVAANSGTVQTVASLSGQVASGSGLVADKAGNLYGAIANGGSANTGGVYEIPAGTNRVPLLASFASTDVAPTGPLVVDAAGDIFGTTSNANLSSSTGGSVYEIVAGSGKITTLYTFASGSFPSTSGLVADASGNLFGTAITGESTGTGFLFEVTGSGFVVCFAAGTCIRIARGEDLAEVAVEHLAVGDVAITAGGERRPIAWLGHRTIDCRRHPRLHEVLPVRIAAHAFGENRPTRDLRVSPGHAICVDVLGEMLIPAGALVNGSTIVQDNVNSVTYWHVELESHDILLAENLPCESYLEMGNRGFFAESGVVSLAASPDVPPRAHADFCRHFVAEGPLVAAVRARLESQASSCERDAAAA